MAVGKMMVKKIILVISLFFILVALLSIVPSPRDKRLFTLTPKVISKYEEELSFGNECVWLNVEKATKLLIHYKISGNQEKTIYWDKYIKKCDIERFNKKDMPR